MNVEKPQHPLHERTYILARGTSWRGVMSRNNGSRRSSHRGCPGGSSVVREEEGESDWLAAVKPLTNLMWPPSTKCGMLSATARMSELQYQVGTMMDSIPDERVSERASIVWTDSIYVEAEHPPRPHRHPMSFIDRI